MILRDFRSVFVSVLFVLSSLRNGCSRRKYICSDRISSLAGRAVKFLLRHHSESPACEAMAGLLSAHFVLPGILPPIHCAPHWGTTDREEE